MREERGNTKIYKFLEELQGKYQSSVESKSSEPAMSVEDYIQSGQFEKEWKDSAKDELKSEIEGAIQ